MSKVKLYIARHGKTMFNTIGRVQGWSDSPLTPFGEEGIRELGLGLKAAGIPFKSAYSSDSGRTIQTMDIILRETGLETIPTNVTNVFVSGVLVVLMVAMMASFFMVYCREQLLFKVRIYMM